MKFATHCFEPFTIATLRVLTSAITLGAYCFFRKTLWVPKKEEWLGLITISILGFCYPFAMQPLLISYFGSAFIGIVLATMPLFTLILGRFIIKAKFSWLQFIGIMGGLFFTYLLMHSSLNLDVSPLGFALAISISISYTLAAIYIKRDFAKTNPIAITANCAAIAFVLLLPLAISNFRFTNPDEFYKAFFSVIMLGVMMSGFSQAVFYYVIQRSDPLTASLTNYLIPIFALFWGLFDGEKTSTLQICAVIGIMAMIYITRTPPKKHEKKVASI